MPSLKTVIVDADAIVAQIFLGDVHHDTAIATTHALLAAGANVIYPVTAIIEAITFTQRVLGSSSAAAAGTAVFTEPSVYVEAVDQNILRAALTHFRPEGSKKNTLFDCIVLAIAKKHQADAIFSFDGFYRKKGIPSATSVFLKS